MRGGSLLSGDINVCAYMFTSLASNIVSNLFDSKVANYLLESVQALQTKGHTPYAVSIQVRNKEYTPFLVSCADHSSYGEFYIKE